MPKTQKIRVISWSGQVPWCIQEQTEAHLFTESQVTCLVWTKVCIAAFEHAQVKPRHQAKRIRICVNESINKCEYTPTLHVEIFSCFHEEHLVNSLFTESEELLQSPCQHQLTNLYLHHSALSPSYIFRWLYVGVMLSSTWTDSQ